MFSTRNYTANKHNEIANKHRENSLSVLQPLLEVVHTENARDILLTRVAEATFGQSSSGYAEDGDKGLAILNSPNFLAEQTKRGA